MEGSSKIKQIIFTFCHFHQEQKFIQGLMDKTLILQCYIPVYYTIKVRIMKISEINTYI